MEYFLKQILSTGKSFEHRTHAELLNKLFGTNYKAWMKCGWRYSKNAFVWFVRMDGKPRNEFTNTWLNQDSILQRYVGKKGLWDGEPIKLDVANDYRLVFEISDGLIRKYTFKGVFLMDRNYSTPDEMIFKKVSNVYPLN